MAGMDGLAHVFVDCPHTSKLVAAIAASGAFVTACLTLNSSAVGNTGAAPATNKRVSSNLNKKWLDSLSDSALGKQTRIPGSEGALASL